MHCSLAINSHLYLCSASGLFLLSRVLIQHLDENLNATNQGANGTMSNVKFQIANLDYLAANDGSNYALNNVGGPARGSTRRLVELFRLGTAVLLWSHGVCCDRR